MNYGWRPWEGTRRNFDEPAPGAIPVRDLPVRIVIRSSGQPLAASFMDYGMPRADDLPSFRTEIAEVLSPTNPLGIKAGGEGGTTPALATLVNAVVDALAPYGVEHIDMPVTPLAIWRAIQQAKAANA